jgi:hypothetical protein
MWYDGVFYNCDSFEPDVMTNGQSEYWSFCKSCEADIRKPEPETQSHNVVENQSERVEYLLSIISSYEYMIEESHKMQRSMISDFKVLKDKLPPEAK